VALQQVRGRSGGIRRCGRGAGERDSEGIGLRARGMASVAAGGCFGEFGFE
jgi:hypothetical protein